MIREATIADCEYLAKIYNEYLGKATMDIEEKIGKYFENILAEQSVSEKLYVLEIDEMVIGWGILKKYSDRQGYAKTGETSVYLHKDFLFRGFGKLMKKHLIEKAEQLKYKHLVAKIWARNKASIKYNSDFGYTIVGTQHKVGYVNGKYMDVVIMQYVFE
ncbi:MAG: N-acetyltransferase family protein [Saprospiraceae bacterium]